MNDIIKILTKSLDFIGGTGRTDTEIESAQEKLGLKFADDYKAYLRKIGLACFDGHELTGICEDPRLNVVDVTISNQEDNPKKSSCYVIEEANIDGIVIWQDASGLIYMTEPNVKVKKISESLVDYIQRYR